MSSGGSDFMLPKGDLNSVDSLANSLLVSISEITASVVCMEIKHENFIEIGCYLYRASIVILELQTTKNTPAKAVEILQSLSRSVNLAKEFIGECQKFVHTIQDSELGSIMEQLEWLIRNIGENLSLIPSSAADGDQDYVDIAVKSISWEMKYGHFEASQIQVSEKKDQERCVLSLEELPKEEPASTEKETETDLYPIDFEVSMENLQLSDTPHHHQFDLLGSTDSRSEIKDENSSTGPSMTLPQVAQYMEPMYETFFCPLTKKIMDDPVTIESGVTYERKAVTEWYNEFENTEEVVCPKTGQKLVSRALSTNLALKATIDEWKERNDEARVKVARAALSLASTDEMILEAINDLQSICQRKQDNKVKVCNTGIIPLLAQFMSYKDRNVRFATLKLLQKLAEDDDNGKEIIGKTISLPTVIKMLSSNHQPIRHASLLLLLELSRSQPMCEKIGSVTGGILMLITIKYRQSADAFASENADEILKNLERITDNIKFMADNGHWQPLLDHLIEGCEEMKMEMASYLGDIILGPDCRTYVAEKASPALIKMVHCGDSLTRNAAFKALKQISSYHQNGKILKESGVVQIMVKEMFSRTIYNEPMDSRKEAAAILANILETGIELENLQVNTHGHTMRSDYIIYNIICGLKNSTPDDLNISLIRILLCLMRAPKSSATIVSVVKETDASYSLIELINNPNEELGVSSIRLLVSLSPFMGHTIIEKLCKTRGQPESLIMSPTETSHLTEKHAVSANFLAKLPHQNLTLNLALQNKGTVPTVLQSINQIQRIGTRANRFAGAYFESLLGILVRFTTTLYDYQVLSLAREYNFTSVFTELLLTTSCDEVHRLSAIGLENLSLQSVNLSKPPQIKRTKFMKVLQKCLSFESAKAKKILICPVHRGACSSQYTFCLLDAKAVERLLACLDHENVEVVEAALSAICTLMDDNVDVDKSVNMLSEMHTIQQVLKVLGKHKGERLRQKSFWVIERFLRKGGDTSASDISQDRLFPATLISAFHHGDMSTRQMAEKILRHLNKMPNFTTDFTM
ncbi:unnamed protein product [Ilex paraguariensis]|uniref:RING-type E3 ubiquitin transferase n=1 Tax=Ilex paraguariensis TaxID=185542 RepID=A0ABC8SSA9_9AQUA